MVAGKSDVFLRVICRALESFEQKMKMQWLTLTRVTVAEVLRICWRRSPNPGRLKIVWSFSEMHVKNESGHCTMGQDKNSIKAVESSGNDVFCCCCCCCWFSSKKDTHIANRHVGRCSTSLINREINTKTTMEYYSAMKRMKRCHLWQYGWVDLIGITLSEIS